MKKNVIALGLAVATAFGASVALAAPSDVDLSVTAKEVGTNGVQLKINASLDSAPGGRNSCKLTFFACTTTVGATSECARVVRIATTTLAGSRKTKRYTARLTAVKAGSAGEQTQINIQASASCKASGVTTSLVSNADATNVTCDGTGVTANKFLNQLNKAVN